MEVDIKEQYSELVRDQQKKDYVRVVVMQGAFATHQEPTETEGKSTGRSSKCSLLSRCDMSNKSNKIVSLSLSLSLNKFTGGQGIHADLATPSTGNVVRILLCQA